MYYVSCVFIIIGLIKPIILTSFYKIWTKIGEFIGGIISKIIMFIWKFSSAVTPTSIGGSAVALVVLSQEKLSTAKTATIVVYTIILDGLYF